jgi:hypothetical protein
MSIVLILNVITWIILLGNGLLRTLNGVSEPSVVPTKGAVKAFSGADKGRRKGVDRVPVGLLLARLCGLSKL